MNNQIKLILSGTLSALSASICCILPSIALFLGATITWIHRLKPWLILLTVLIFSYSWYQKLKSEKTMSCCSNTEKNSFIQSKTFLAIQTFIAFLIIIYPYLK